jgi:hypothetical protein
MRIVRRADGVSIARGTMYKIDYDEVPVEKQSDPRFVALLSYMQHKLSDLNEITAICIHEAAHALFQQLAGRQNFTFSGPQITYDRETDTFDHTGASVRSADTNTDYLKTINAGQWVTATAMAYVGAGIAVEELTSRKDNGDFGDRENFKKAFKTLQSRQPELLPPGLDGKTFGGKLQNGRGTTSRNRKSAIRF